MAKKGKFQEPRTVARQHVEKAAGKSSGKKKKKHGAGMAAAAVGLSMVLLLAAGVYAYGSRLVSGKTIYPNVRVAGVDVGGLSASAAQEAVETAVADRYQSSTLTVQLPDRTLSFDPEQTNVALDADLAIREAMAYGRSDGVLRAVINYLRSDKNGVDIELETALQLDTDYLKSMIHETAAAVSTNAQNSAAKLSEDMTCVVVQVGTAGRELDEDGLYEAVYDAFQSGDFTPLVWEYNEIPYETVDLSALYTQLTDQITDACYDEDKHEIIEGVSGYSFDLEAAQQQLSTAQDGATIRIALEEKEPEVNKAKLTNQMFGEKLESRSSNYVNNANRTENLRLACAAINGTIINPGEVFSFNDTVGERTEEKGYKPATIYGGAGESVDGTGGGVCQVASTIYYTTLYLDLEQVEREPHMYQVTYVPSGMDATVYWDSKLDYKFRNTLSNPIKIQANLDGGTCNITFWGVKENDNRVEMTSKVISTFTEADQEEVDETKPVGYRELKQTAYTGAKVEAYKKVYDSSGKLIKEETIYSTYKARPRIYVVGPAAPVVTEPETTTETDPGSTEDTGDTGDTGEITTDPWTGIDGGESDEYWP